jgi:hypothetical protein
VGRAILHSGTVGATQTAGVNGVRALAVSLYIALHPDPDQDRNWAAAASSVPGVLDLLLEVPAGTVFSLNVSDLRAERHHELRRATLAPFGAVQTRVDEADEDHWHMQEVESEEDAVEGTDQALLAAGHPTLIALHSVQEDLEWTCPIASAPGASQRPATPPPPLPQLPVDSAVGEVARRAGFQIIRAVGPGRQRCHVAYLFVSAELSPCSPFGSNTGALVDRNHTFVGRCGREPRRIFDHRARNACINPSRDGSYLCGYTWLGGRTSDH